MELADGGGSQEDSGAIRGRSRTLRLSDNTASKRAGHIPGNPGHPDVRPEDYRRVRRILDEGQVFRGGKNPRFSLYNRLLLKIGLFAARKCP